MANEPRATSGPPPGVATRPRGLVGRALEQARLSMLLANRSTCALILAGLGIQLLVAVIDLSL